MLLYVLVGLGVIVLGIASLGVIAEDMNSEITNIQEE